MSAKHFGMELNKSTPIAFWIPELILNQASAVGPVDPTPPPPLQTRLCSGNWREKRHGKALGNSPRPELPFTGVKVTLLQELLPGGRPGASRSSDRSLAQHGVCGLGDFPVMHFFFFSRLHLGLLVGGTARLRG